MIDLLMGRMKMAPDLNWLDDEHEVEAEVQPVPASSGRSSVPLKSTRPTHTSTGSILEANKCNLVGNKSRVVKNPSFGHWPNRSNLLDDAIDVIIRMDWFDLIYTC